MERDEEKRKEIYVYYHYELWILLITKGKKVINLIYLPNVKMQ